ncbi:MAG: TolC family protein [Pseudomonadota bacterium]
MTRLQSLTLILLLASLGGCATLSRDGGEQEVRATANRMMGHPEDSRNTTPRAQLRQELLKAPLTMEGAVTLALLNNPGLDRTFAELRLTEARVVAATRPRNPGISIARLERGDERETERSVVIDLIGLLTLPARAPMEKRRYEAAKLQAVQAVLTLARDTRLAYVEALGARQRARYAADVLDAAEAGRDLARRLAEAGNFSRLDAAREQAFYATAAAQRVQAEAAALAAREELVRLLGLTDPRQLQLPERLPDLPASVREISDVEQQALDQRVDVRLAKVQAESTARGLRLTKVTRFINVLDLGFESNTSNEAPRQTGYEVSLELPLFDFGRTRPAQAEAVYRRALAEVAETAVKARSEARTAYALYRSNHELARHYRDEVVPLQKQISDEVLLRYNGMLVSTFEVLAQAREQVASMKAYLAALQAFWSAEARLYSTLQGAGGSPALAASENDIEAGAPAARH